MDDYPKPLLNCGLLGSRARHSGGFGPARQALEALVCLINPYSRAGQQQRSGHDRESNNRLGQTRDAGDDYQLLLVMVLFGGIDENLIIFFRRQRSPVNDENHQESRDDTPGDHEQIENKRSGFFQGFLLARTALGGKGASKCAVLQWQKTWPEYSIHPSTSTASVIEW